MAAIRASDADRDSCLEDIEAAFADGRLDGAEREARTQAALEATTLPELADLTSDLRPAPAPVSLSETLSQLVPTRAIKRRIISALGFGLLVPAAIAVVIWVFSTSGRGSSSDPGPVSLAPVLDSKLQLHTISGFEQLTTMTAKQFGTTMMASAAVYPDYASVEIITKDDPRHTERWYFAKGYEGEPSKGTRAADAPQIDLAAVDPSAYVKAIRRAPSVLGVEDVTSTYVVFGGRDGAPAYTVYVSNDYHETGYWTFSPTGKELYRYAFE